MIRYVKIPSLHAKETICTIPSVDANYLADDIFWQGKILFLRRELENKQKAMEKLFNILHDNNNEITKQFFLYKNSAEKKISENVMTNNSVISIDDDSSIATSHQSKFTKDQSTSTANTSEALITREDISDKDKIKNDVKKHY